MNSEPHFASNIARVEKYEGEGILWVNSAFVCGFVFGSSCPAGHLPIPNMRWWNLHHALWLAFLDWSLAEVAETCSDDPLPVVLLQDRLNLEPFDRMPSRHSRPSGNGGSDSLPLRLLQAQVAKQREIIAQNAHMSERAFVESKHTAGFLIAGVILSILLLFALCMASSLGVGFEGATGHARKLSTSDWLVALALGTALVVAQLYAFHHTGLLSLPAGDYAFPLMVAGGAVSFFGPVLLVSCLHCHSSFQHLDDELGHVSQRFDRLERLVSAAQQHLRCAPRGLMGGAPTKRTTMGWPCESALFQSFAQRFERFDIEAAQASRKNHGCRERGRHGATAMQGGKICSITTLPQLRMP
eukprot:Skav234562  [mRNA]  locus=scaffold2869:73427:79918:+ [translate_table: standard]